MEQSSIGKRVWVLADGYIPAWSSGPAPQMESHEALCILNTGSTVANVELTIYFEDKDPVGPFKLTVPPRRVLHQRFNNLHDPQSLPRGTGYAAVISSDVPVVVQQTRLDSRQAENAVFSTIAFAVQ